MFLSLIHFCFLKTKRREKKLQKQKEKLLKTSVEDLGFLDPATLEKTAAVSSQDTKTSREEPTQTT